MDKTISKKKNPGLAKLAKNNPKLAAKFGYNPNKITAKKGIAVKKGYHKMPNGKMMKNSKHKSKK